MRSIAFALCVACIPVAAETPDAGETVTFTRAQIAQMEREVNDLLRQRETAAFEAGQKSQKAACRSLI